MVASFLYHQGELTAAKVTSEDPKSRIRHDYLVSTTPLKQHFRLLRTNLAMCLANCWNAVPDWVQESLWQYEAVATKVFKSDRIAEYSRLTITDKEAWSIHYNTDSECIYLGMLAPITPP